MTDIADIRCEQARLLNKNAARSCRTVEIIIVILALVMWADGSPDHAILWFIAASTMVAVAFLYAKRTPAEKIVSDNFASYLRGHTIISGLTGLTWGTFACFHLDWTNPISVIIAGSMTMIIPVGGMMPSSSYRREYVVLASCTLLPFAFFILLTAPGALRLFGFGTLTYFGLCLASSAQSEINTRDGILARRMQALTRQLQEQNDFINNAIEEKTRFMAATSHDLAQPLHAQGFFIQALRKKLTNEAQINLLEKIEASWMAQNKLLSGLVDITRLDSGAIIPKSRTLALKNELQLLVVEFQNAATAKSITINTSFADVTAQSDPVLFARIIRNVLSNAIKFTLPGGVIDFGLTEQDGKAIIIVADSGIGIPKAQHAAIFEEYRQLANPAVAQDQEAGLGLGLSIVKRLSELLFIDMDFDSVPGKGTTFTFSLDAYTGDGVPQLKIRQHTGQLSSSPLIILVDDEIAIREGMTALLSDWGAQLICTATGAEAIDLLSQTNAIPALLIIDKRLKNGENGIELIERLREEVNELTPAILMTGDLKGFDGLTPEQDIHLMTKPVEPRDIKNYIEGLLSH